MFCVATSCSCEQEIPAGEAHFKTGCDDDVLLHSGCAQGAHGSWLDHYVYDRFEIKRQAHITNMKSRKAAVVEPSPSKGKRAYVYLNGSIQVPGKKMA